MNIFARKLVCLLVCLCQIIVGTNTTAQFNGVMEEGAIIKSYSATISQQSINEISNALDLYFDCLYSSRADLSTKLYYNSHLFDRANIEAIEFYERDIAIMNSLADALLTHGDMYKYCTYTTKKDYSITEVNGSFAKAVASIECDFSYVGSPEIDSASWLLYEVQLVNYQNHWEVISRSYPEFTEANINIDDYVTENHNALSSLETHCETVEADARLLHPYNRNLAAYNAN